MGDVTQDPQPTTFDPDPLRHFSGQRFAGAQDNKRPAGGLKRS